MRAGRRCRRSSGLLQGLQEKWGRTLGVLGVEESRRKEIGVVGLERAVGLTKRGDSDVIAVDVS